MGLEAFVTEDKGDKSNEDNKTRNTQRDRSTADKEPLPKRIGRRKYIDILMLFRTRDKDGNFMGPDPPSKFEQAHLPEEEWDDRWIDATGEFEYKNDRPIKYTDCQNCGKERIWTGHRSRHVRCSDCGAVHMDKFWKDDRVENKNMKDGLDKWV